MAPDDPNGPIPDEPSSKGKSKLNREYFDARFEELRALLGPSEKQGPQLVFFSPDPVVLANSLRKTLVALLKGMPYELYLKTDHWKALQEQHFTFSARRCRLCKKNESPNLHHNNYDRVGEEWFGDLLVLCRECHAKHHNKTT